MKENVLKVNLNPTKKHFSDIEKWLIKEFNETNQGFYCSFDSIISAFSENRLSVITENDYAIGFVVYTITNLSSKIELAEIKPSQRRNGIAKKLVNGTLGFIKSKGVLITHLYCSPENSEQFWKKMGFYNFPKSINYGQIKMYRPILDSLKSINPSSECCDKIQLWETYCSDKENPKYEWKLKFERQSKKLIRPVILPVNSDWNISLTLNGNKLVDTIIKRVGSYNLYDGQFLIITDL